MIRQFLRYDRPTGAFALMLVVNAQLAMIAALIVPAAAFVARHGGRLRAIRQARFADAAE